MPSNRLEARHRHHQGSHDCAAPDLVKLEPRCKAPERQDAHKIPCAAPLSLADMLGAACGLRVCRLRVCNHITGSVDRGLRVKGGRSSGSAGQEEAGGGGSEVPHLPAAGCTMPLSSNVGSAATPKRWQTCAATPRVCCQPVVRAATAAAWLHAARLLTAPSSA